MRWDRAPRLAAGAVDVMGECPVPYRLGTAVTSLTQEEQNQCVQVGFSDGSSGEYDLVVGADGLGSTVRELALRARPRLATPE